MEEPRAEHRQSSPPSISHQPPGPDARSWSSKVSPRKTTWLQIIFFEYYTFFVSDQQRTRQSVHGVWCRPQAAGDCLNFRQKNTRELSQLIENHHRGARG